MSFLKKFFSNSQSSKSQGICTNDNGFLEKDAAPVQNTSLDILHTSNPRNMSAELTNSIVQELTDPNNSNNFLNPRLESHANNTSFRSESNTMNVHNANQQVVMQFSNVNKLHIGSVFNVNSNNTCNQKELNEQENGKPKCRSVNGYKKKTTSIEAMMQSKDEPDKDILQVIATHLGIGWKQVMRELGYSEGQMQSTFLDYNNYGIQEVILQLLWDWVRNAEDDIRNVGYLTKLLWNCGHRDCVHRLKKVWKDKNNEINAEK